MSFGNNLDICYKTSGRLCPHGYAIIECASGAVAVSFKGAIVAAPQHNLAIECKAVN